MKRFCLFLFLIPVLLLSAGRSKEDVSTLHEELSALNNSNDAKSLDRKAIISNDIALYYQFIKEHDKARIYFHKAIDFTEQRIMLDHNWDAQNVSDLLFLYRNLSVFEASSGHTIEAKEAFENAEDMLGKLVHLVPDYDYTFRAAELYETGFVWAFHAQELELAITFIEKSLNAFKKCKDQHERVAEIYRMYGELWQRHKDNTQALRYVDLGIDYSREHLPNEPLTIPLVNSKITILYAAKDYNGVIQFLEEIKPYDTPSNFKQFLEQESFVNAPGYINNAFILSFAYIRAYQSNQNASYIDLANQWQDVAYSVAEQAVLKSGAHKLGSIISAPQQKITSTLKRFELLQENNLLNETQTDQLLRVLDIYNSTSLHLERLNNEASATSWEALKQLKSELNSTLEETNLLETTRETNRVRDSLKDLSFELTQEIAALEKSTKTEQVLNEYRIGQDGFQLRLNQHLKETNETLLTYFWSSTLNQLYIVGKNQQGSFFEAVQTPAHLSDSIRALYHLNAQLNIQPDNVNRQNRLNKQMYELFISPVQDHLSESDGLLIYPLGELSYVSFEALINPATNNYLVQDHDCHYASSIFSIIRKTTKQVKAPKVSVFYPSDYGTDSLAFLFHAEKEVEALKEYNNAFIYEGKAATKQQFVKAAKQSSVLHIASHSILEFDVPYQSHLIFDAKGNPDNHFHAFEIFAKSFDAELITLSSCNSSSGAIEEGIGVVSLSNAFYFSGIPATVGSMWSAQDKSSADIMVTFYKQLNEGHAKSKSLTFAKRNYLETADAITQQPFFWANYVLYGSNEPITPSPQGMPVIWYIVIGVIALLALTMAYRYWRSRSTFSASE